MRRADLLQRALQFLAGLEIEPEYTLRARPVAVPAPPQQPKQPRVLLHHVLLLGSPSGKTEPIEGRVHRCVRARSPAAARKQFERLAREIMELQGLGWRRSAVKGLSSVDLGPFRLIVDDDMVWLATEVPRDVWNAFT